MYKQIIPFLKNKKFIIVPSLAVVLLVSLFFRGGAKGDSETINPIIGDLVNTVRVSGKVIPSKSVNLAFEKGGIISIVLKEAGDTVTTGEPITSLDGSGIYANYLKAQADLNAARAELAKLSDASNSQTKIENARYSVVQEIVDAYTQSDDAVHSKIDQFFTNARSTNPEISSAFEDEYGFKKSSVNSQRLLIEELLTKWGASVSKIKVATFTSTDIETARNNLSTVSSFLDVIAGGVNNLSVSGSLTQTSIDKYRTDVASARTNVNNAISSITTVGEKLRESTSDVPVQTARVLSAEANVASFKADLDKIVLRAPFAGVVSKQDAKVGQSVSANSAVTSVISTSFEIEAYVSEVSIAGVLVGNKAEVTLDAYGADNKFTAEVMHVDPAETIRDGVSTYKVNLIFKSQDSRIKSGMTTNIDIETVRRPNTLLLPKRAILEKEGLKIVFIKTGSNSTREQVVVLGFSDSKGNVEVVSGLTVEDSVLLNPTQ